MLQKLFKLSVSAATRRRKNGGKELILHQQRYHKGMSNHALSFSNIMLQKALIQLTTSGIIRYNVKIYD